MANDKEVIKKLLKIAENQQKIITKLAQTMAEGEPLAAGPGSGGSVEGGGLAGAIKGALHKLFPKMVVKTLEVKDEAGSRPSLTMMAENAPPDSALGPTLVEQFLLRNKIPTSILVNGKELHKA
jgi:hypothetical protein